MTNVILLCIAFWIRSLVCFAWHAAFLLLGMGGGVLSLLPFSNIAAPVQRGDLLGDSSYDGAHQTKLSGFLCGSNTSFISCRWFLGKPFTQNMTVWALYATERKRAKGSSVSTVVSFSLRHKSMAVGRNFGGISDQVNYNFSLVIRIKK
jgi:hypothetical protein